MTGRRYVLRGDCASVCAVYEHLVKRFMHTHFRDLLLAPAANRELR